MTGIIVNPEAATYDFPVKQRGRYTVDREVFERLASARLPQYPDGVCNRVPISELPSMWPANGLREKALEGGRIFIRDMASHGLEALTPLEGLVVIGPYKHRRFNTKTWIPNGLPTTGERQDEDLDPGAADFILEGTFLERRGRLVLDKNGNPA